MSRTSDEIANRFGFHAGTSVTVPKHARTREAFIAFAEFLDAALPDGRAKSSAMTKLQEASFWAHFGIAELAPLAPALTDKAPRKKNYTITNHNDVAKMAVDSPAGEVPPE